VPGSPCQRILGEGRALRAHDKERYTTCCEHVKRLVPLVF